MIIVMDKGRWEKISSNWRTGFVILFIAFMFFSIRIMYSPNKGLVNNGRINISEDLIEKNKVVALNGHWEFYWDRLLTSEDFITGHAPQMDSFIKVPGSWDDKEAGTKVYPNHGVATYRLIIKYPSTLKDPALSIKTVSAAYKLFANGQEIIEIGKVSDTLSDFVGDYKQQIVELPKNEEELELIFQVANLDYIRGGLRDSIIFGSKQTLEQKKLFLVAVQLIFIGIVFGFSLYYLILFFFQRKNKTALIFSTLCFITAMRALGWGELPLMIFFPSMPIQVGLFINYIAEYNLMPFMILFVISIYPLEYKKQVLCLILLPSLIFQILLLAPAGIRASFNSYLYILVLLQMIYILSFLIKAVLHKQDNAELLLMSIGIFILTLITDQFTYKGIGRISLSYLFLYGNFAVIIAMSYIQAKQQAVTNEKLILYNKELVEADRLKDKIIETEMSFLQAQIKPHFLYNALSAIANVCEMDGKKASKLIIDLAMYLRGSLEFNNLNKMSTLEKELEFIVRYFNIEQARFGQKIQLVKEIEIPLDYQIPVLILQPLVENAVRHGISKKLAGGRVILKMKQIDEGIVIEIKDDGIGMNEEKLNHLFDEKKKGQSVGLINIHHRLLRLYGRGLKIKSILGHGTCVKIMIPEEEK